MNALSDLATLTRGIIGYRDVPADFVERWCRVGWDGARDEFGAHNATIDRWITAYDLAAVEAGTPMLHELRREWLEAHYALHHPGKKIRGRKPGSRASRYVAGRTLTAVIERKSSGYDGGCDG